MKILATSDALPRTLCASHDHYISPRSGAVRLRLRERRPAHPDASRPPLLLVHGATLASVLWDNPAPGWSLMERLAEEGLRVFGLDVRGYGRSSRPADLEPGADLPPYARACDVQEDIRAALLYVRDVTGADRIDLFGGSWGSITCGMFAAGPDAALVRRLVLYAPIYCEPEAGGDWLASCAAPEDRSRLDPRLGPVRWVRRADILARWDPEIPCTDKTAWRPSEVLEGLFETSLAEDPGSCREGPEPAFRAPTGALADLFEVYNGRPLYDAQRIETPTLLIRGDRDATSTHADATRLFERIGARRKHYYLVGHGAHFVVAELRMPEVHELVSHFLRAS